LEKGETQWIIVNFNKPVRIEKIEFKFQGGFCSSQIVLESLLNSEANGKISKKITQFYPQDINSTQVFRLK
jgi:hypothetical protein